MGSTQTCRHVLPDSSDTAHFAGGVKHELARRVTRCCQSCTEVQSTPMSVHPPPLTQKWHYTDLCKQTYPHTPASIHGPHLVAWEANDGESLAVVLAVQVLELCNGQIRKKGERIPSGFCFRQLLLLPLIPVMAIRRGVGVHGHILQNGRLDSITV